MNSEASSEVLFLVLMILLLEIPYLCGMSSPPSKAPFRAPKTRAPVLVLAKPTSRKHLKAPGDPSTSSTL